MKTEIIVAIIAASATIIAALIGAIVTIITNKKKKSVNEQTINGNNNIQAGKSITIHKGVESNVETGYKRE